MKPVEATKLIRNLSKPSKMPCYSWSISADLCITGNKLAQHENTVCGDCYAKKGNYVRYECVANAHKNHIDAYANPLWVEAMTTAIGHYSKDFFRWFDSGDLQSVKMLRKIKAIAANLSSTFFWLPTKESAILRRDDTPTPENLVIRLSGYTYNAFPTMLPGSIVYTKGRENEHTSVFYCRAYQNAGKCGDCRACWNKDIPLIGYPNH